MKFLSFKICFMVRASDEIKKAKEEVGEGYIKSALEKMLAICEREELRDLANKVIGLKCRLMSLERDYHSRVLSHEDYETSKSRIIDDTLYWADSIEERKSLL